MAFGAKRVVKTVEKEVLKFPAGLNAIESVVLQASAANQTIASATTGYQDQLGLLAGTILTKVPGDPQKRYRKFTGASGEAIEGILGDNIYFYDDTDASDEPADMLKHECVFVKDKIIDYNTHAAALATALFTCRFEDKETP